MIIIEGWVRFGPGEMDRLRATFAETLAATRKEEGCLEYSFAVDVLDPNILRIAERWQDDAAVAAHGKSAHMAAFGAALRAAQIEAAKIKAYTGEFQRAIMSK